MLNKPDLCSGDYLENAQLSFLRSIGRKGLSIGIYGEIIQMAEYNCAAVLWRAAQTANPPFTPAFLRCDTVSIPGNYSLEIISVTRGEPSHWQRVWPLMLQDSICSACLYEQRLSRWHQQQIPGYKTLASSRWPCKWATATQGLEGEQRLA